MIGLSTPSLRTAKLLAALAVLAATGLAGGGAWLHGYRSGKHAEATGSQAREAGLRLQHTQADNLALQTQLHQLRAAQAADQAAVAGLQARLAAQAAHAKTLTGSLAHVRLTVPTPVGRPAACAGDGPDPAAAAAAGGPVRPVGGPLGGAGLAAAQPAPGGDGAGAGDPGLTLSAVGLWNAALYPGEPGAPELAPVACRFAGTPAAATAAAECNRPAGISLAEAFGNHIANALGCAQDRERLGRLIAAVQAREQLGNDTPTLSKERQP